MSKPESIEEQIQNNNHIDVGDEKIPISHYSEEIEYLYLNFSTVLPRPVDTIHSPKPAQAPPPPCPNLAKYASPFLWSPARKTVTTVIACLVSAMASYAAGEYTAPSKELMDKWHVGRVVYNLGITFFTLGFGIAPMILAPFSEFNGRRPIFLLSGFLFTACLVACGGSHVLSGLLLSRFFLGVGGSTFSTMVGGVISDIYHAQDRNAPMAWYSGAVLFGTGLGPVVTGFIPSRTSWRWIYYSQAIVSGVCIAVMFAFMQETRGSVLLSRKAAVLNRYYEQLEATGYYGVVFDDSSDDSLAPATKRVQRIRWRVKSDEERDSLLRMIAVSCYRPFHLLFTEPVVFFFSLWAAFSWGILYLQFSSIPLVFETNYGFNVEQAGAVCSAISIGTMIITPISIYQEKLVVRYGKGSTTPEGRLYLPCAMSILLPIGLFWFGWTSNVRQWIVPSLAVGCSAMGIFSVYLAVFNYFADTYHRYASTAIAAAGFSRNMLAGAFPLVTNAMFTNLGYPGASSLLGGIGILLTIVPWILVFYGPRIRARSKFANEIMHGD